MSRARPWTDPETGETVWFDQKGYNAKCAEVNQQRDHFAQREREFDRWEKAYRIEIADLKKENQRLQALVDELWSKVSKSSA